LLDPWTDLLGCLQLRVQDSERSGAPDVAVAHGRCFGRGDVLTEDGALVASYAQAALLRFREADDQVGRLSVRISHI
jgi:hypothetical protein